MQGNPRKLRVGLPKGSLQEATFALFKKAGFEFKMSNGRSYHPTVDDDDLELILLRPQEIPRYVEQGILDAGLTGKDWIEDNGSKVIEVSELPYSKATRNPKCAVNMPAMCATPTAHTASTSIITVVARKRGTMR